VARWARLWADQRQQGIVVCKLQLMDALYPFRRLFDEIGSEGVVDDAKHELAQRFCRQFNFEEFPDTPKTLWLPIAAIDKLHQFHSSFGVALPRLSTKWTNSE